MGSAESTAGSYKIAVLDKIKSLLEEIEEFSESTRKGFVSGRLDKKHIALIHFSEDNYVVSTTDEDVHEFGINLLIRYKSDINEDPESEMDNFIDLVGKVEDKLKENYTVLDTWEDLRIERINYTFGQERQAVYYNAMFNLVVRTQW